MIEAQKLTKFYGQLAAIKEISFSVEKGEILGFLGPNGAGKSTTMRILAGYIFPTSGTARIAGFDVVQNSLEVRRRIGYMPEIPPLSPDMTIHAYLDFVARVREVSNHHNRLDEVMEICDIRDKQNTFISKLSKGYKQRVGLAQTLVHDPEVLILDEPTIGLDPKQVVDVRTLIRNLAGERTIILSTHILPEATMICERVLIINKGMVIAEDTPQELSSRLEELERVVIRVEKHSSKIAEAISEVEGVVSIEDKGEGQYEITCRKDQSCRTKIAQLVSQYDWGLSEMTVLGMTLEEIFLQLTSEKTLEEGE